MKKSTFQKMINFLIEIEYDSQRLYHEISSEPKLAKNSAVIKEIARNEILHAKELEKLRLSNFNLEMPENLIEKHNITEKPAKIKYADFHNYNEAIRFCIKEEEKAIRIYKDIARCLKHVVTKELFNSICKEEEHNKKILQKLI